MWSWEFFHRKFNLPDNYYNWIIFMELGDKYPEQSCGVNINEDICGKNSEIQSNILSTQFLWFD